MQGRKREHTDGLEANKDLGRRFFAEQDRLRGGPSPELCTPDYVARLGGNPPMPRAGHEAFARMFYAAFEGMRHDVELAFAEADQVLVRFVLRGVQTGPWFGVPASGRSIAVAAHVVLRVQDGRVRELIGIFDEAGLLRQSGALPV
jgi:predicted ester cyclase